MVLSIHFFSRGNAGRFMTDFYHENFQDYYDSTADVEPSSFLSPLLRYVPPDAEIFDLGCGSGRDLRWLKQRDFRPTGLERSPGLAALAKEHSGCEIIRGDFETFDFSLLSVDAVILIGALVHLPPDRMEKTLGRILKVLRKDGLVLISMKQGDGKTARPDGRVFYLWRDHELRRIFERLRLKILDFFVQPSGIRKEDVWLGYVLRYHPADLC